MAHSHSARGQNSPPSYIDGISVKISEKYKPPKRITLALSYSQILTLNKLIQDLIPNYEFSLEESIKNKMHEWRKARVTIAEERRQRLHNLNQERNSKTWNHCENTSSDQTEVLSNNKNSDSEVASSNQTEAVPETVTTSGPYYSTESGVLIPMAFASQQSRSYAVTNKGFNFSEFESDTSSPFDNMELKTINDLEELAEVLKRDCDNTTILNTSTATDNNYINNIPAVEPMYTYTSSQERAKTYVAKENQINGYYYNRAPVYSTKAVSHPGDMNAAQASVSEIMRSLEAALAATTVAETPAASAVAPVMTHAPASAVANPADSLNNPYPSLSSELQRMVVAISTMGFPLARVARACQALDGNQKKIVEHLLALTDLLDLGFPEQQVVNALLKCNNDRDKALDLLIT